jgi:hypothetical protein
MTDNKLSTHEEAYPPFAEVEVLQPALQGTDLLLVEDASSVDEEEHEAIILPFDPLVLEVEAVPMPPFDDEATRHSRKIASCIVSGGVGWLVGGPLLGVSFGSVAVYATDKPGVAGDAMRAVGEVGMYAKERAEELDRKHQFVNKTRYRVSQGLKRAAEVKRDRRRYLEQTQKLLFGKCFKCFSSRRLQSLFLSNE